MSEHMMPIPSRIYNSAVGGHVCGPEDLDFGQKVVHLIKYDRAGNEVSFESQVTQANKIYVIHDDFVLSSNVTIPANCVLEFDGGSVSGAYTLTGDGTGIWARLVKVFNTDVTLDGTWNVSEAYPEWFGGKSDGITDSTVAIQRALNLIADKTILRNGTYLVKTNITECIKVPSNSNIILDEQTVIKGINENNAVSEIIRIAHVNNVSIQGGSLYGDAETNTDTSEGHGDGLFIDNSANITIRDIKIHHCHTDGCYIIGGTNILFENCSFEDNGRMGHTITNGNNIKMVHCKAARSYRVAPMFCFGIEPNYDADVIKDIVYDHCIAEAESNNNNSNCFYFNIAHITTNHDTISIKYDNCVGYNGVFFFGGMIPSEKLNGWIEINNYTSINARGAIFVSAMKNADYSVPIILNHPVVINGNTSNASVSYGSFFYVQNDTDAFQNGGIVIKNADLKWAGNLHRRLIVWTAVIPKDIYVENGDFENNNNSGIINYIGTFPFSKVEITENGLYSLLERHVIANSDTNLSISFRAGIPKNTECFIELFGTGSKTIVFNSNQIINKSNTNTITHAGGYGYIKLRWVDTDTPVCEETENDSNWSFS